MPEIAGRVTWVAPSFAEGGFFEADDVLVRIDPFDYEQALVSARSQLAQARLRLAEEEAEAEVAQREWNALGRGDPRELALRKPQLEDARASVAAAEAGVERATRDLQRAEIVAPYAGRVRTKNVDIGQYVRVGDALATVYAVDIAEIRLPLPDDELAYLDLPLSYRGVERQVQPDVTLRATFAGETHVWNGRIVRTESEIDSVSRMVHAVAEVEDPYAPGPNPNRPPLAVGMYVEAEIGGRTARDVAVLPRQALRGREQVLVVTPEDRLSFRTVDVLRTSTESVILRAGLQAGELVVISPLDTPTDGMQVQLADADPDLLARRAAACRGGGCAGAEGAPAAVAGGRTRLVDPANVTGGNDCSDGPGCTPTSRRRNGRSGGTGARRHPGAEPSQPRRTAGPAGAVAKGRPPGLSRPGRLPPPPPWLRQHRRRVLEEHPAGRNLSHPVTEHPALCRCRAAAGTAGAWLAIVFRRSNPHPVTAGSAVGGRHSASAAAVSDTDAWLEPPFWGTSFARSEGTDRQCPRFLGRCAAPARRRPAVTRSRFRRAGTDATEDARTRRRPRPPAGRPAHPPWRRPPAPVVPSRRTAGRSERSRRRLVRDAESRCAGAPGLGPALSRAVAARLASADGLTLAENESDARYVVRGGIQQVGPLVRVTARIVDTAGGAVVHAAKIDGTSARIDRPSRRTSRRPSSSTSLVSLVSRPPRCRPRPAPCRPGERAARWPCCRSTT